jgi:DNA-binding transcriptional LysR family regulator
MRMSRTGSEHLVGPVAAHARRLLALSRTAGTRHQDGALVHRAAVEEFVGAVSGSHGYQVDQKDGPERGRSALRSVHQAHQSDKAGGEAVIERHEIEAFLAVAEELHFRRATERLGLAQGRVSQIIKGLERRLGVALFARTSRRVALTPSGQRLHDGLAPAYRRIQETVAQAVAVGKGVNGTLRVGFSSQWAGDLVLETAEAFRGTYPDCVVEVQEVQLADTFGPLRAGTLDVQLTEFPVDEPDLVAGPLIFSEPRALLVPEGHPFARLGSVCMEDLARAPLIVMSGVSPQYWRDNIYPRKTPQGRPITHGTTAAYWQEVPSLVASGRGVSPAALLAARYYARPGIAFVPFRDAPPLEYGLIWRCSAYTARVRAFVETLCRIAPGHAAGDRGPVNRTARRPHTMRAGDTR